MFFYRAFSNYDTLGKINNIAKHLIMLQKNAIYLINISKNWINY